MKEMSMPNQDTQQKFQSLADEFRAAADLYFNLSVSSEQEKVLTALRESFRHFTKKAKQSFPKSVQANNGGCPPGWFLCDDGSCVPRPADCPKPPSPR
jgi:hypothetical protein